MGNVGLRGTGSWKCGFRREMWEIWGSEEQKMGDFGSRKAKNGQFGVHRG